MSEAFNRAGRKSRSPYILVAIVCLAILAAAIVTNRFKRDSAEAAEQPAVLTDVASPALGTPPPRKPSASVAERTARMTASMRSNRAERKQKLQDARLAAAERFQRESVDPAWSAAKESRLQALADSPTYKQAGVEPSDLQIDCRSTLCKVTANHDSHGSSADWAMIYMTSSAPEVKRTFTKTVTNPDGTASVEIYALAR